MVETTESKDDRFVVVGAGHETGAAAGEKRGYRERWKGKPVISAVLLGLIILGCVFAPVFANHDPTAFYLDSLNTAPNAEFYFGTDSLGRDLYSIMFYGGRTSLIPAEGITRHTQAMAFAIARSRVQRLCRQSSSEQYAPTTGNIPILRPY